MKQVMFNQARQVNFIVRQRIRMFFNKLADSRIEVETIDVSNNALHGEPQNDKRPQINGAFETGAAVIDGTRANPARTIKIIPNY